MTEESPWTRLAAIWNAYQTRSYPGDAEHNATHLDRERLCLCALASISKSLDEINEALRYRKLLDERALVPYAQELEARRERAYRWIEQFIRMEESKRGPLERNTRAAWAEYFFQRAKPWIECFDVTPHVHSKHGRIFGAIHVGQVESDVDMFLRVRMPYSWKKRSKRYKVFAAWMRRRVNRKR